MATSREIHVLPYGPFCWSVRRAGQVRELSMHPSHAEAEQAARVQARIDHAPLVVHSPAGTRQEFPAPPVTAALTADSPATAPPI